jgi:hypothetical protein
MNETTDPPTVDDLRVGFGTTNHVRVLTVALQVKLCYICREEERYDSMVHLRVSPIAHNNLL